MPVADTKLYNSIYAAEYIFLLGVGIIGEFSSGRRETFSLSHPFSPPHPSPPPPPLLLGNLFPMPLQRIGRGGAFLHSRRGVGGRWDSADDG